MIVAELESFEDGSKAFSVVLTAEEVEKLDRLKEDNNTIEPVERLLASCIEVGMGM